jgi:hypothetical protein
VHYVEPNELWILWKEFGGKDYYYRDIAFLRSFLAKCCGPLSSLSIFDLKVCTEKGINENSWLWNFQIFLLFLSWNKNIESVDICGLYKRYILSIPISYDKNNEKIWKFHNQLFSMMPFSMQSRKSKVSFLDVPRGTTTFW